MQFHRERRQEEDIRLVIKTAATISIHQSKKQNLPSCLWVKNHRQATQIEKERNQQACLPLLAAKKCGGEYQGDCG
jgi:hypothetical protein